MEFRTWEELPHFMKNRQVLPYYQALARRRGQLFWKRWFDFFLSSILLFLLFPVMMGIAFWIKLDSKGPIFYRQERVTQYGRRFWICKFRTMTTDAEQKGGLVTIQEDKRITRSGKKLRRFHLDELPQLINVWKGEMSFVGTRPEVFPFVRQYDQEMFATLLLPAGITSEASIRFRDEAAFLEREEDARQVYVKQLLPEKMKYNLRALACYSFWGELGIMIRTVWTVFR